MSKYEKPYLKQVSNSKQVKGANISVLIVSPMVTPISNPVSTVVPINTVTYVIA